VRVCGAETVGVIDAVYGGDTALTLICERHADLRNRLKSTLSVTMIAINYKQAQ